MNKNDEYIMQEAEGLIKVNRIKVKNSEKINIELIVIEDGPIRKVNKELIEKIINNKIPPIFPRSIIIDYDISTIK